MSGYNFDLIIYVKPYDKRPDHLSEDVDCICGKLCKGMYVPGPLYWVENSTVQCGYSILKYDDVLIM